MWHMLVNYSVSMPFSALVFTIEFAMPMHGMPSHASTGQLVDGTES